MQAAEDYLAAPANLARSRGFETRVVAIAAPGDVHYSGPRVLHPSIEIETADRLIGFVRLLVRHRGAIVYANFRRAPSFLAAWFASRSMIVAHAALPRSRWKRIVLRTAMQRFTMVRALTSFEVDDLVSLGIPRERIALIPLAIDSNFFGAGCSLDDRATVRRELEIPASARIVLAVANARKLKRLDTTIDAVALLVQARKPVKLVIAGDDLLAEEGLPSVAEMADAAGIRSDVIITGFVEPSVVRKLLQVADVFVNSSETECQCLAACEAAAAGVPLCLSAIPGLKALFKGALFHEHRDHAQLAANILSVLDGRYPEGVRERHREMIRQTCDPHTVDDLLSRQLLGQ